MDCLSIVQPEQRPLGACPLTGALEQDADLVLFIFHEEVYDDNSPNKGLAEIIVAKHRNGPTGKAVLWFDPALTRFGDLLTAIEAVPASDLEF